LLGGHFSSDILEGERLEAGEFLARPASTVLPHRVQAQALTFVEKRIWLSRKTQSKAQAR
jgi:hypothetical protein